MLLAAPARGDDIISTLEVVIVPRTEGHERLRIPFTKYLAA
jgi:hypothetical protein